MSETDYDIHELRDVVGQLRTYLIGLGDQPGAINRIESTIKEILKNQTMLHDRVDAHQWELHGVGERITTIEDKIGKKFTWWRNVGTKIVVAVAVAGTLGLLGWVVGLMLRALRSI